MNLRFDNENRPLVPELAIVGPGQQVASIATGPTIMGATVEENQC